MCTVTNEIKKIERAFDVFNARLYNGELERPVIQFYADDSQSAEGWITTKDVWSAGNSRHKEINISANFADRDAESIYATLLHEMAHLYNMNNGIKDISSGGYYHNRAFKSTAEAHGLIIGKDDKYGWIIGTLNEEAKEIAGNLDGFDMSYERIQKSGSEKKKRNSYRHYCPVCGAVARTSKRGVHLVCGDCMEPMIEEE